MSLTTVGGQFVTTETVVLHIPAAPGPPVGLTAPDNVRVDSARDTVSWDAVTGATQYSLRIEQDGIEVVNRSTSSASQDLSRPISGPATVKVKACYDAALTICGVDAIYELATAPPAAPRQSPPGGSSGRGSKPTPAPQRAALGIPTQDHSQLPAGAEIQSDSPWIAFREVSGAEISDAGVRDAAMSAIDVWGPMSVEAEVCFDGYGSLLLLDTAYSPRMVLPLFSYLNPGGLTCAQIDRAGTVALVPGIPHNPAAPQPTATPTSDPYLIADDLATTRTLSNCAVSSDIWLNLRLRPAGPVAGLFIGDGTATARTANWYRVSQDDRIGWISAHYVTTSGACS